MEITLTGTLYTPKLNPDETQLLENVRDPRGESIYPKKGVTLFYGPKSTSESLLQATNLKQQNESLHTVTIKFKFEKNSEYTGLSELPNQKTLNLSKLKKDLSLKLKTLVEKQLKKTEEIWDNAIQQGYTNRQNNLTTSGMINSINNNPSLLDHIWLEQDFNHIHIIIYPSTINKTPSNRATVFRRGCIVTENSVDAITIPYQPEILIDFKNEIPH